MWIVKNPLRATLSFRGIDISIPSGEELDLDTALGRGPAEDSNQIQVAFEEGYLENVFKAAEDAEAADPDATSFDVDVNASATNVSAEHLDSRLDSFKTEFLEELRTHLPRIADDRQEMAEVRDSISQDVKTLVGELKDLHKRFQSVKGRVETDSSLSDAEVKARMAFLEEQERELLKNFESVGKQIEQDDGDVMDMADMLSNL